MFVCYLDDSNNDNSDNLSLAGYYAHATHWEAFEKEVASIFVRYRVNVMRGTDLFRSRNDFKEWSGSRKYEFVDEVFSVAGKYVVQGISTIVRKSWFNEAKMRESTLKNVSPLGLAFSSTLTSLIFKSPLKEVINRQGISFVVENGNSQNGNIERFFHHMRLQGFDFLKEGSTLEFAHKRSSYALMMADMLAFHSRRAMDLSNPHVYPRQFSDQNPAFGLMRSHISHRFNHLWATPHREMKVDMVDQSAITLLFGKFG